MAGFPTMKKSKVDYQVELDKFDWKVAREKAAIPFEPSGVTKAKQLIEEAKAAKLAKPYGKAGVVDGNLVFRIKYGGEKHYGKGDIVLVADFETATAEPELSAKAKNQGVLHVSGEKNPLTSKWWEQTLGSNPDPVNLGAHLARYESKQAALSQTLSRVTLDAALEALSRLDDALRSLPDHFDAENDRRIIARLQAGHKATAAYLHSKQDKYAQRLRVAGEKFAESAAHVAKLRYEDALTDLQAAKKAMDEGRLAEAQQSMLSLERRRQHALQELSAESLKFYVVSWAEDNDINAADVPMELLQPAVKEWVAKFNALQSALEELRRRAAEVGRDTGGEDLVGEVAQFQTQLDKLRGVVSDMQMAMKDGEMLLESGGGQVGRNLTVWKLKDIALKHNNTFNNQSNQLIAAIANAAQTTAPGSGTATVLNRLRSETEALGKRYSDQWKPRLARLIKRVADLPQLMAPLVKEALERGQRAQQLHDAAENYTIQARMQGLSETQKAAILKELEDGRMSLTSHLGKAYGNNRGWWYVLDNFTKMDQGTNANVKAARKTIEQAADFLEIARRMIEETAPVSGN